MKPEAKFLYLERRPFFSYSFFSKYTPRKLDYINTKLQLKTIYEEVNPIEG